MRKKVFRLTENELRQIVRESVARVLMNEWNGSDELAWEEYKAGNTIDDDDEEDEPFQGK